jgi:hypothetical protein
MLDTNFRQLNPVHPGEARKLLSAGKAAVYRRYPFTIILKRAVKTPVEPLRVKIDPGSKTTGIAVVNDTTGEVVFAAELSHQGEIIKKRLDKRRGVRRSRRNRRTRYRQARWRNRRNKKRGWLPPSLQSRITNSAGRMAARATGSFNITTKGKTVQGIGYQYCKALHRSDGYSYQKGATIVLAQPETETVVASPERVV